MSKRQRALDGGPVPVPTGAGGGGRSPRGERAEERPRRRFSVLITVKLPPKMQDRLRELCRHAHAAGVVLDVASWEKAAAMPKERMHCMLQANAYHGLLCGIHDTVDEKVVEMAPSLRVVSTISARYDHIDAAACGARDVRVGNTLPAAGTVADTIVALMLAAARRLPAALDAVREAAYRGWDLDWLCGKDVHGSTVGLVELGRNSPALVERLRGFGCRIVCHCFDAASAAARSELGLEAVTFEELLRESDFVVPQCALSERTYHLFDAAVFAAMKRDAVFVNVVYGPVCDHAALYAALSSGAIGAAAVDVVDPEPFEPTRLRELPNCILVPNLSSATERTRTAMVETALNNLVAGLFRDDRPTGADEWLPRGTFVA